MCPPLVLARFIAETTSFDRLYLYGGNRPLHVSCGPSGSRAIFVLRGCRRAFDPAFYQPVSTPQSSDELGSGPIKWLSNR